MEKKTDVYLEVSNTCFKDLDKERFLPCLTGAVRLADGIVSEDRKKVYKYRYGSLDLEDYPHDKPHVHVKYDKKDGIIILWINSLFYMSGEVFRRIKNMRKEIEHWSSDLEVVILLQ